MKTNNQNPSLTSNTLFDIVLVNGEITPTPQAQLSLTHPVFTNSHGVYESIQIDQGHPFHLKNHLQRLQNSANIIEIPLPSLDTLLNWGLKLIKALPPVSYSLRILAIGQAEFETTAIVVFFPQPTPQYSSQFYTQGASAITYEGQRAIPQCKSFNTLVNHLGRLAAKKVNVIEAILTEYGEMTEGCRSNLFVVEAGRNRLLTPPANKVVTGITRDVVIDVMQDTPYPVQEAEISWDMSLAEMFITSTSMHVLPITTLNGIKVGSGSVGKITRLAMERFEAYYQQYLANTSQKLIGTTP